MIKNKLFLNRIFLFLVSILYLLICIYFLPYFQYHINPDGISQISIALKYSSGNVSEAINPYWGASFALLTAILIALNIPMLLASKIIIILSGLLTLLGLFIILDYFILNSWLKKIYLISFTLVIPYFVFQVVTADLLFTAIFIWYLSILFKPNFGEKTNDGIITGIVGALLYLTRENGFYFFLIHFSLIVFYYFKKTLNKIYKKQLLQSLIFGLITFLLLSSIWISALSVKYNRFIIGSKSGYIWSWIGPDSLGLPAFTKGIIDLPNSTALSNWEDPTKQTLFIWNPLSSKSNLFFEIKNTFINSFEFIKILKHLSFLIFPIFTISFVFLFQKNKPNNRRLLHLVFLTVAIYMPAYLISYVGNEQRYFWIILILAYLLGCYLMEYLSKKIVNIFSYDKQKAFFVIFFLNVFIIYLFIIPSFLNLVKISKQDNERSQFIESQMLSKYLNKSSQKISSNEEHNKSLILSFFSNNHYVGQTTKFLHSTTSHQSVDHEVIIRPNINDLIYELKINRVNYYLVWNNDPVSQELIKYFPEVKQKFNQNLKIYQIN